VDWDAEGLCEGLEDDRARAARRRLLDELYESGVSLEELRRTIAEDKLVLAPVARALSSQAKYTAREIAAATGVDLAFLAASRRALGLPVPGDDERVYGEKDLEASRLGSAHRAAGFADEDALEVARVLGQGMARYAEATRALVARTFLEPGLDEYELAHRYRAVAEQLMPLAGPWLEHVFALHLQQVLRSDALTQEQRRAGKLDDTQDAVVAFADLVGFTELGESVSVEELGSVAGRLSHLAADALEPEVRIVKLIGDAVMLVSPKPEPILESTLRLIESAAEDASFPPLRAGVACGQAVHRWGDWFGTPVNLASRLTARARPSTVLVSAEIAEGPSDRFVFSDAGRKKLKGFAAPVHAFRAKRVEP
jgi:adenylate cyclase